MNASPSTTAAISTRAPFPTVVHPAPAPSVTTDTCADRVVKRGLDSGRGRKWIPEEELIGHEEGTRHQQVSDDVARTGACIARESAHHIGVDRHLRVERDERHWDCAVEHTLRRHRVHIDVPLCDRGARVGIEVHVSRHRERAAHHDDVVDLAPDPRVGLEGEGQVGQRPESEDGDRPRRSCTTRRSSPTASVEAAGVSPLGRMPP